MEILFFYQPRGILLVNLSVLVMVLLTTGLIHYVIRLMLMLSHLMDGAYMLVI